MAASRGNDQKDLIDSTVRRLRISGCKVTRPRRVVLDVLCRSTRHLSSAEIVARVHKRDPRVGRASVFRTLETLSRLAIARPAYVETRGATYVVIPEDGHHAHIVCTGCGRVIEMSACEIDDSIGRISEQHHVTITGHLLEIYGLCTSCSPVKAAR